MTEMYGSYSDEDLNEWERMPQNIRVLTSSAFGAWLLRRDKRIKEKEPKTGHWITTRTFMHDGEYYCDKCKCDAPNNEKWDYCPNCGARMSEVSE